MKAVSGRYLKNNPLGTGRRRASSAANYPNLPNHEPRYLHNEVSVNGGIESPPPPYSNSPHYRKKQSRPSSPIPTLRRFPPSLTSHLGGLVLIIIVIALGLGILTGLIKRPIVPPPAAPVSGTLHTKPKPGTTGPWDPEKEPRPPEEQDETFYPWLKYPNVTGFYNGVRTLVPTSRWVPEALQANMYPGASSDPDSATSSSSDTIPLPLQRHSPYPVYDSKDYLADFHAVNPCFLDAEETTPAPDIFSYPGIPQQLTTPLFGSYEELGLSPDSCFERYGRFGPYGYGYEKDEGGLGIGILPEQAGSKELWKQQGRINWKDMDWGDAQRRCHAKNAERFETPQQKRNGIARLWTGTDKKKVSRQAYVLRAWTGIKYTPHEVVYLRAMINELSLKSGGEYDVHLLLHVRDDALPIWTDKKVYREALEKAVPKEFWGITTIWSVPLMRLYYPGPLYEVFEDPSGEDPHGVYRAQHLALQWFGHQHPEYDFVWNWEMDIRYSGHLYEFHQNVAQWAKKQPRRGLWERSSRYWIPAKHGNYSDFIQLVDDEMMENGEVPVWGPVSFPNRGRIEPAKETTPPHGWLEDKFEWGVGEEADLITFNPIFDPSRTNWIFRADITGYSTELPIPPRRCAIVTVARLSRRLLDAMHEETLRMKHSAFPEMWPPTVALHHGLKAVYIPHPIYFEKQWPLDKLDEIYNYPKTPAHSVFGWGEHYQLGNTFYYNSVFSGKLWRRWLGEIQDEKGGKEYEEQHTGRMCLRPILHHPIKSENARVV